MLFDRGQSVVWSQGAPDSGRAGFGHSVDATASPENAKLSKSGELYGGRSIREIMYGTLHIWRDVQTVVLETLHQPLLGVWPAHAPSADSIFRHVDRWGDAGVVCTSDMSQCRLLSACEMVETQ